MNEYLRPIDDRFQINGISMPRPHSFKLKRKWNNLDAERDINTGHLILNPINRIYETTWEYKLLIDDQYDLIYNQVFSSDKANYGNKVIKTIDSNTFHSIEYTTYEQDDFEAPAFFTKNGHRFYQDVVFQFTSIGEAVET